MKVTKNLYNNYIVTPDGGDAYVVPVWDTEKYAEVETYLADNPDDEVPYQPTSIDYMAIMANYAQYLTDTDWYIVRKSETGAAIPVDVLQKRQDARDKISELRLELQNLE